MEKGLWLCGRLVIAKPVTRNDGTEVEGMREVGISADRGDVVRATYFSERVNKETQRAEKTPVALQIEAEGFARDDAVCAKVEVDTYKGFVKFRVLEMWKDPDPTDESAASDFDLPVAKPSSNGALKPVAPASVPAPAKVGP